MREAAGIIFGAVILEDFPGWIEGSEGKLFDGCC